MADENGQLAIALRDNNYFVSDTNYGWGPEYGDGSRIGDHTDIPDWYSWFSGPNRATYLAALYSENGQTFSYTRLSSNPAPTDENEIILFKSCYPNSQLSGNPDDPPADVADNTSALTVAEAKRIYLDTLTYFATRQDKLFVAITAPPLTQNTSDASHAANARAFNNWLMNDWLDSYSYNNVAVFDFYNIMTSNATHTPNDVDVDNNDVGQTDGNHHRWWNGVEQHIQTVNWNYAAYTNGGDSHPGSAGNLKATTEFVPLLNAFYHRWKADPPQVTPRAFLPYMIP